MPDPRPNLMPSSTPHARGGYTGLVPVSSVVESNGILLITNRELRIEAGVVTAIIEKGSQRVTL